MSKTLIPEFMITINDDQHCFINMIQRNKMQNNHQKF